jgi:hypothetical protein
VWTVKELEDVLRKTLPSQSKTGFVTPKVISAEDIGNLISIKSILRGKSGKIIKLEIQTTKQIFTVEKELVIRRCFQKNNISIPSANFVITYIDSETPTYKFSGGGFGHGVGLSQWGAGKMCKLGFTFDEILQHYYTGIKLATIPIDVLNNGKIVERRFYTDNDKAKVFVKNHNNLNKMKISINNRDIDVKLKEDITEVNISRYLQKGENKISYLLLDNNAQYSNKVTVFTEVKGAINE